MNLQLNSLLTNVKKRLYDNFPQYWINQYNQSKLVKRVLGMVAIINIPITYIFLTQHWNLFIFWNFLIFSVLAISSIESVNIYIKSFLNLHKNVPYKKLLNNSLSKEQLYDFCEQEIVAHFSGEQINIFPDFNIELTNEELQQVIKIKFNHEQLAYLYTLLKDERKLKLCHLFQLERIEEISVENYEKVFNNFIDKNELENKIKLDLINPIEEEKESYYEKYL